MWPRSPGYDVLMLRSLLPALALLACGTSEPGDTGGSGASIVVSIDSPADGDRFDWDESITLEVSAKTGPKAADIGAVTWTVADREVRGESTEISDLDPGDYTVNVDVVFEREHYEASVDITVLEKPTDTGDTGSGGPGTYAGSMATHVWYDGEFGTFDGDCPGTVNFTVSEAGVIDGTGHCTLDGEYAMDFLLDGNQGGGEISGALIGVIDGQEVRTPYTGTGKDGETFSASYDKTFRDGGDSIRIEGTWTAEPQ